MSERRGTNTADEQIDLWHRLRAEKPETLRAVEDIAAKLTPEMRQRLWRLLADVYRRAKHRLPMPHDVWKLLSPEQRSLLADEAGPE